MDDNTVVSKEVNQVKVSTLADKTYEELCMEYKEKLLVYKEDIEEAEKQHKLYIEAVQEARKSRLVTWEYQAAIKSAVVPNDTFTM